MVLRDILSLLETRVFTYPSRSEVFNPYQSEDRLLDLPDAASVRQRNVRRWLEAYCERPQVVIVGKAPSGRGFRFSGVPFVSERQLGETWLPFSGGRPTSQASAAGPGITSSHDTRFWTTMKPYLSPEYPRFLTWNCVPFHLPGVGSKAREPYEQELSDFSLIARDLIALLHPVKVIALGSVAERALNAVGVRCCRVHSVSNDYARQFPAGIEEIFAMLRR